jgi:hypothetical protein
MDLFIFDSMTLINDQAGRKTWEIFFEAPHSRQDLMEMLSRDYENNFERNFFVLKAVDYRRFINDLKGKNCSMFDQKDLDQAVNVILCYEKIIEHQEFIKQITACQNFRGKSKLLKDLRICLEMFDYWDNNYSGSLSRYRFEINSLMKEEEIKCARTSFKYLLNECFRINASDLSKILGLEGEAYQKCLLEPFYMKMNLPKSPVKQERGREGAKALLHGIKHEKCAFETFLDNLHLVSIYQCERWKGQYPETFNVQKNIVIVCKPDAIGENVEKQIYPIEFKCPYSKKSEKAYIKNYWLQIQCEIRLLDADFGYFVIWTPDSTEIFKIERDNNLWIHVEKILAEIYKTSPPNIPDEDVTKDLKSKVNDSFSRISELNPVESVESKLTCSCCIKNASLDRQNKVQQFSV